jgi:tRNA pseudouridine38-40 synthase
MARSDSVRLRLEIAYDGTAFQGWAKQPGLRTVQGELESALSAVFRRFGPTPVLTVAGRTDAGVHALGQVAHVDLTAEQFASLVSSHRDQGRKPDSSPEARAARLARRLNGIAGLSSDLYVSASTIAPPGFDARFSASWRRYEYRVADASSPRNPLTRNQTLWYPAELDVETMDATARALIGLHDFAAYCKPREGATTIRTLQEFRWRREPNGILLASVRADAFCHSMVRALVGASIAVGEGKLAPGRAVELLQATERTAEFKVVPAKGLILVEVGYPGDAELGARADQTRARRDATPLDGLPDS